MTKNTSRATRLYTLSLREFVVVQGALGNFCHRAVPKRNMHTENTSTAKTRTCTLTMCGNPPWKEENNRSSEAPTDTEDDNPRPSSEGREGIIDLTIEEDDELVRVSSVCNSDCAVENSSRGESKASEKETLETVELCEGGLRADFDESSHILFDVPVGYSPQPRQSGEGLKSEENTVQEESFEGLTGQSAGVQLSDGPSKSGPPPTSVSQSISSIPSGMLPEKKLQPVQHGNNSREGSRSYYRCTFCGRFAKKIECCDRCNHLVKTVYRSPYNHNPPRKGNCSRENKSSCPVMPINMSIGTKHPVRCVNDPVSSTPLKKPLPEPDAIHERKQQESSGSGETTEINMEEHVDGPEFKRRKKRNFTQILSLGHDGHTLGPLYQSVEGVVAADHPRNPNSPLIGCTRHQIRFTKKYHGWPWENKENHRLFVDWYERLKPSFEGQWRQVGIADALSICVGPCEVFPIDLDLLFAAACFWDTLDNTFHFSVGPMTITLLDLEAIGGFSATGIRVDPTIQWGSDLPEIKGHYKSATAAVTKYHALPLCFLKPDLPISDEEHIRFLAYWLCRYCCCSKALQVTTEYFRVATALAFGKKVALGPIVLANIYRGLALLQKFQKYHRRWSSPALTGALWVVQMWLQAYFPFSSNSARNPGELFGLFVKRAGPLEACNPEHHFVRWHDDYKKESRPKFHVFCSEEAWLASGREATEDDKERWAAFLVARDLPYGFHFENSTQNGVVAYSPHYVARQFGLIQSLPAPPQTRNTRVTAHIFLRGDYAAYEEFRKGQEALFMAFQLQRFTPSYEATRGFREWWKGHLNVARLKSGPTCLRRLEFPNVLSKLHHPFPEEACVQRLGVSALQGSKLKKKKQKDGASTFRQTATGNLTHVPIAVPILRSVGESSAPTSSSNRNKERTAFLASKRLCTMRQFKEQLSLPGSSLEPIASIFEGEASSEGPMGSKAVPKRASVPILFAVNDDDAPLDQGGLIVSEEDDEEDPAVVRLVCSKLVTDDRDDDNDVPISAALAGLKGKKLFSDDAPLVSGPKPVSEGPKLMQSSIAAASSVQPVLAADVLTAPPTSGNPATAQLYLAVPEMLEEAWVFLTQRSRFKPPPSIFSQDRLKEIHEQFSAIQRESIGVTYYQRKNFLLGLARDLGTMKLSPPLAKELAQWPTEVEALLESCGMDLAVMETPYNSQEEVINSELDKVYLLVAELRSHTPSCDKRKVRLDEEFKAAESKVKRLQEELVTAHAELEQARINLEEHTVGEAECSERGRTLCAEVSRLRAALEHSRVDDEVRAIDLDHAKNGLNLASERLQLLVSQFQNAFLGVNPGSSANVTTSSMAPTNLHGDGGQFWGESVWIW